MANAVAPPRAIAAKDPGTPLSTWRRAHVLVLTVLSFVGYAGWSLLRDARGESGWDLAIFDQAVLHYSGFQPPISSVRGHDFNVLGDHFSPITAVLAPLYWIWSDPRMLLIAQAALVAASIPVVARFVGRHVHGLWRLPLVAAYALGWPLQTMLDFDFHEVAFAVPLLAVALDALDRRSDRALVLALAPLLLVREDMGLVVVAFGLVRALRAPRRVAGPVLVGAGVAAYLVVTLLLVPMFSATSAWNYWTYDALGPDLPSSLLAVVQHPLHTVLLLVDSPYKVGTLFWLFVPLLLLPLRSPYVIVALPFIAERFLSSRESLWFTFFHYSAVLWPILFLAAIDGARRLGPRPFRRVVPLLAAVGLLVPTVPFLAAAGPYPITGHLASSATWDFARRHDQQRILARIPASTCVEAAMELLPRLTHRNVVSVPAQLGRSPDFVAVDLRRGATLSSPAGTQSRADAVAAGYDEIAAAGPYRLLRSPTYDGPSAACRP